MLHRMLHRMFASDVTSDVAPDGSNVASNVPSNVASNDASDVAPNVPSSVPPNVPLNVPSNAPSNLAKPIHWKVRKPLSHSLHEVARILGPSENLFVFHSRSAPSVRRPRGRRRSKGTSPQSGKPLASCATFSTNSAWGAIVHGAQQCIGHSSTGAQQCTDKIVHGAQ